MGAIGGCPELHRSSNHEEEGNPLEEYFMTLSDKQLNFVDIILTLLWVFFLFTVIKFFC